ncbi:MAG: hypothetical protein HY466_05195 [Deltaproteobacteria bacterium]|nr:hypothetical protein [Deltaproteobacteria bacterium]
MKPLSPSALASFARWGRQGGRRRRRALSAERRRRIASQAACTRWGVEAPRPAGRSIRLEKPAWDDPVFLEEVLDEGALSNWRELYRQVADRPFGEVAQALEKVLSSAAIYGATPLWRGLLKNLQGGSSA